MKKRASNAMIVNRWTGLTAIVLAFATSALCAASPDTTTRVIVVQKPYTANCTQFNVQGCTLSVAVPAGSSLVIQTLQVTYAGLGSGDWPQLNYQDNLGVGETLDVPGSTALGAGYYSSVLTNLNLHVQGGTTPTIRCAFNSGFGGLLVRLSGYLTTP
jgi:hypothetical protein